MRVIETFVTSVPREKIPADAKWFMQDPDDGLLKISNLQIKPGIRSGFWLREGDRAYNPGSLYTLFTKPVSSDAAETVVTREELMRAYDLVEQGYTLWFGGDCPVECGAIVDVVFRGKKRGEASDIAGYYRWSSRGVDTDIIAYRLSRSADTSVTNARDAAALKTRLEMLDKVTGGVWPGADDEKFLVTADGKQLIRHDPEKLITRAQWDDYVSRKIRVGDKVKTWRGGEVEILFLTADNAAVRYNSGAENMLPLGFLTRISQ